MGMFYELSDIELSAIGIRRIDDQVYEPYCASCFRDITHAFENGYKCKTCQARIEVSDVKQQGESA